MRHALGSWHFSSFSLNVSACPLPAQFCELCVKLTRSGEIPQMKEPEEHCIPQGDILCPHVRLCFLFEKTPCWDAEHACTLRRTSSMQHHSNAPTHPPTRSHTHTHTHTRTLVSRDTPGAHPDSLYCVSIATMCVDRSGRLV